MIWIITALIGVLLLHLTSRMERYTGESKTFARYTSLAIIGFSLGALFTVFIAV